MAKKGHWTIKSFSINIAELPTTWKDIVDIAKTERVSISSIIVKALREYAKEHGPGNSQTKMISYSEGGAQTVNQLVGQLRQRFKSRGGTTRREILESLKEAGVRGPERVSICMGLIKWLKGQGVEVLE